MDPIFNVTQLSIQLELRVIFFRCDHKFSLAIGKVVRNNSNCPEQEITVAINFVKTNQCQLTLRCMPCLIRHATTILQIETPKYFSQP